MEAQTVTEERRQWEQAYERATPEERERMIEEHAKRERRARMTIPETADEIVRESFADMAGDWRDMPA
jgi:hypothetical protein